MAGLAPGALGSSDVERQHAMVEPAGMPERHHPAVIEHVLETQHSVLPNERFVAGADHHPANLRGHAEKIARLHQAQLDQRIGAGDRREPRDLGPGIAAHRLRNADAVLDQQGSAGIGLEARGTDRAAGRLVDAQHRDRVLVSIEKIRLDQRRMQVRQVVPIRLRADATSRLQILARTRDSH